MKPSSQRVERAVRRLLRKPPDQRLMLLLLLEALNALEGEDAHHQSSAWLSAVAAEVPWLLELAAKTSSAWEREHPVAA